MGNKINNTSDVGELKGYVAGHMLLGVVLAEFSGVTDEELLCNMDDIKKAVEKRLSGKPEMIAKAMLALKTGYKKRKGGVDR